LEIRVVCCIGTNTWYCLFIDEYNSLATSLTIINLE
jgi:hypothetical protein